MQAEDDERRDLERILSARPRDDGDDREERRRALRRLRDLDEAPAGTAADGEDAPAPVSPPEAAPTRAAPVQAGPPAAAQTPPSRRRRTPVIALAAVGGVALGALAATALLLPPTADPVTAPSASPSASPADRFAALVETWEPTTDVPAGLALLAGDAPVYASGFDTAQDDRLLITAPDQTQVCLAVQRPDATFIAGCTGADAFWAGEPLRVSGTALVDGSPVYTQITLHPDGSIEGGYQVVPTNGEP